MRRNESALLFAIIGAVAGSHAVSVGELFTRIIQRDPDEIFVLQAGLVTLGVGIFLLVAIRCWSALNSQEHEGFFDIHLTINLALLGGFFSIVNASVGRTRLYPSEAIGAFAILIVVLLVFASIPRLLGVRSDSRVYVEYMFRICLTVTVAAALGGGIRLISQLTGGNPHLLKSDPSNAAIFGLWSLFALSPRYTRKIRMQPVSWSLLAAAALLSVVYQYAAYRSPDGAHFEGNALVASVLFPLLQLPPTLAAFFVASRSNPNTAARWYLPLARSDIGPLVLSGLVSALTSATCYYFAPENWIKGTAIQFVLPHAVTAIITVYAVLIGWRLKIPAVKALTFPWTR